ncbi:MAG: hypothetical protein QXK80_03300 [Candidatus Pacearchaeota archaeon]
MAKNKNKSDILEKIIVNEAIDETFSCDFKEDLYSGGKNLTIKFELEPEDVLYSLCFQKKISFEDLSNLFDWFERENKIYVISKKFNANLELLRKMSNKQIMEFFKNHYDIKYFSYNFCGKEIYFFSYLESNTSYPYYGNKKANRIAKKGIFDEQNCKNLIYCAARYKADHRF